MNTNKKLSSVVKLPDNVIKDVQSYAKVFHRSIPKQIEHWIVVGKTAEENPDLPYDFIKGILMALEEVKRGEITEYVFDS